MFLQRQRLLRALNRVFGAFALIVGITFTARVLSALVRGLSLRQLWLAGILGLALILVGILYVRAPAAKS